MADKTAPYEYGAVIEKMTAFFMATHIKKSDLPSKVCAVCARPFAWRKKWAAVWDDVRYCSERCRRGAKSRKT